MNLTNLKTIRRELGQLVATEPRKLNMGTYISHPDTLTLDDANNYPEIATAVNECGTVACVAGWIVLLHSDDKTVYAFDFAKDWLDIDNNDEADNLFFARFRHEGSKDYVSLCHTPPQLVLDYLDRLIAQEESK